MTQANANPDLTKEQITTEHKKPYRSPKLFVYGDLSRITHGKGGNKGDGNGNPATKG